MDQEKELKLVLFTDLDGTLLNSQSYSYEEALPAIRWLRERQIPVIFCSAKTRAEQEAYRKALGINDPFIVEEGSAILIPRGYFPFHLETRRWTDDYAVIELGLPYEHIKVVLNRLKKEFRCEIKAFGDLLAEEIARDSGLSLQMARLAKQREYTETLKLEGTVEEVKRFLQQVEGEGLHWSRGERYYRIKGRANKGEATRILLGLFRKAFGQVKSIAIGNSLSDGPMLRVVDYPVLLKAPDGGWAPISLPKLYRFDGSGPTAWSKAIEVLVSQL